MCVKKLEGLHRFCVVELHAIRNYSKKQLSENELMKVAEEVQEWEGLYKHAYEMQHYAKSPSLYSVQY